MFSKPINDNVKDDSGYLIAQAQPKSPVNTPPGSPSPSAHTPVIPPPLKLAHTLHTYTKVDKSGSICLHWRALLEATKLNENSTPIKLIKLCFVELSELIVHTPAIERSYRRPKKLPCGHPLCMRIGKAGQMVTCIQCNMVSYCSKDCMVRCKEAHSNVCVGTHDFAVRQNMDNIVKDLDAWHQELRTPKPYRPLPTDINELNRMRENPALFEEKMKEGDKTLYLPVTGEREEDGTIHWLPRMPLIVQAKSNAPGSLSLDEALEMDRPRRDPNLCMLFATNVIYQSMRNVIGSKDSEKISQFVIESRGRYYMRCATCLGPTKSSADLFLLGKSENTSPPSKEDSMLIAGSVIATDEMSVTHGNVWITCSPECAMYYSEALMSRFPFRFTSDGTTGRVQLDTQAQMGIGLFHA